MFDLYKVEDNVFNRWDIVEKITDENHLKEIAINESEAIVYESAFGKLKDENVQREILEERNN